ncbi:MAG: TAT-variant-translocated molybdopterin oxidoreductase [Bacteroidetes bacterium]|nr:TAT-variant-translocated molybdopterin oxidoreductase [Bacteroidota bacterium]
MSNSNSDKKNSNIWKSLKEYYNDPEIFKAKANEFNEGVTDDFDPSELKGLSRRRFLAVLTASAAVTATACSDYREKGEIIPYNKRPEGLLPGRPNYYASSMQLGSDSYGILIKTREGRPIKIEGNPDHPINKGKINDVIHASILNLYDPERLSNPLINKRKSDWISTDEEIISKLKTASDAGKEIAVVTNRVISPTVKKVFDNFKRTYSSAKFYSYELFGNENKRAAWKKSYNTLIMPSVKLDKANIILSLDSDFLGREGNTVENTRLFTDRRDVMKGNDFNRLYVAEGALSLTGSNADYRLRIRPDAQFEFVMSLLNEIVITKGIGNSKINNESKTLISKYSLNDFVKNKGLDSLKVNYLVNDLIQHQGKAIVIAGDTLPVDLHIAVNLLNEILSNTEIYDFEKGYNLNSDLSTEEDLNQLTENMTAGKIGAVIHFDTDPVYHLSSLYNYASALEKVETKITLTESENDTSAACNYVLPINHVLESWGDYKDRAGVYCLQQPVIAPLFDTRQAEAVILTWSFGSSKSYSEEMYHKFLMESFKDEVSYTDFNDAWYSALHDGFVVQNVSIEKSAVFNLSSIEGIIEIKSNDSYLLHLQPSYFIGDGKYANNGWLQEIPHPVSKVAWDNYAAVSPSTAKELNVKNDDVIEITVDNKSVKLPVIVQPGTADKLIAVELGYGRNIIGDAGKGAGVNVCVFISNNNFVSQWITGITSVAKIDEVYKLASTQEHHALDDMSVKDFHRIRNIIQEGTVGEYIKHPGFLHDHAKHELFSISKEVKYNGLKWAMAIDLNKCIGCTACITSCNVENNIPVVGKDQVARGREMQWIRIDRYYSGTPDEPVVSNQPMLCQHCDNAPCENVCPVNATNHSPDGLNQMAYNRCVGTRYCANNCPYKVRRFNFYNFRDNFADAYYQNNVTDLVHNPEVTVRSRGVMEKCTFCVQRIMEARSEAIKENKQLKGDDVQTACQVACPSNAIVFGDSSDKESEVSKYRDHDLAYHVLEELNVRPNVTYIAKLRNTHSEEV